MNSHLDILTSLSGQKITTVEQWETFRRPEILNLFQVYEFGIRPLERPHDLHFEVVCEQENYLDYPIRIFPVGRLDKDSQGLLLMTSDGEIVNRLLRASGGHEKEYEVEVDRPVTREFLEGMMKGVPILDTVTLPCKVRRTGDRSFNIIIVQGLNRQIRRMCEYFGYNVRSLRRIRIMNIRLGNMKPGQWRELTKEELDGLLKQLS